MSGIDMRDSVPEAPNGRLNRRIRNLAWGLVSLALAFYFGFIAITLYRSHR